MRAGMKVVCIDDGGTEYLVKDKIYSVLEASQCPCCECKQVDVGVRPPLPYSTFINICKCGCEQETPKGWYLPSRFVPLEDYYLSEKAGEQLIKELTQPVTI